MMHRGAEDLWTVHDEELGSLLAVTIGCDVSSGQSWHVDHVEVTHAANQQRRSFPCRMWLEQDSGDGYAQRRLLAAR